MNGSGKTSTYLKNTRYAEEPGEAIKPAFATADPSPLRVRHASILEVLEAVPHTSVGDTGTDEREAAYSAVEGVVSN